MPLTLWVIPTGTTNVLRCFSMMIDLIEAMKTLHACRLRSGCQMLSDGAVLVWLGDGDDRQAETSLPPESVGSAGSWLLHAARRLYPDHFAGDIESAPVGALQTW
jgi:hypothetical protein